MFGLATLLEGACYLFSFNSYSFMEVFVCEVGKWIDSDKIYCLGIESNVGLYEATGLLLIKCYDNEMVKSPGCPSVRSSLCG